MTFNVPSRITFVVAAVVLASPAVFADLPDSARDSQIIVSGLGTVSVPPTKASFSLTVTTTGATAAAASEENARTSKSVRDALARSDLKPSDIKGSSLTIGPRWDYEEGRRPRRTAYEATNTISVETENLASIGAVIDIAMTAGATEVSEIDFASRDIESARANALTRAVQAARSEAEVIARANGGNLGELLLMSTQPRGREYGLEEVVVTGSRKRNTTVVPSDVVPADITVTSRVEGRWRFTPGGSQ